MYIANKSASRLYFWVIWLLYSVVYMTKNCFTAAMASVVFEGIMTKSQVGFIVAAFYIVYAPLQVVSGVFADKYRPERLIIIGLCGGALANLVLFLNRNYSVVLIVWIINAVFQSCIWPAVFKIVSSRIIYEDRANATFFISIASTVGLMLSYAVAALLPRWYYNFAVSSVSLLLFAVLFAIADRKSKAHMCPETETGSGLGNEKSTAQKTPSAAGLFLASGFALLLLVVFLETLVGNSARTFSSTMLMESYDHIPPAIGNYLNVLIIGFGVTTTVFIKCFLYPKRIKSAPVGILFTLIVAAVFSMLCALNKGQIFFAVLSLCVLSGVFSAVTLFASYCCLEFETFHKSGTMAGVLNGIISAGLIVNNYGVTRIADHHGWQAVSRLNVVLTVLAVFLTVAMIPLWKAFKKKYGLSGA